MKVLKSLSYYESIARRNGYSTSPVRNEKRTGFDDLEIQKDRADGNLYYFINTNGVRRSISRCDAHHLVWR